MIQYCIQVLAGTGFLYLLYLLFLKNRSSLRLSRAYLLGVALLPLLLPLLRPELSFAAAEAPLQVISLPLVAVSAQMGAGASSSFVSRHWAFLLYAFISGGLLLQLLLQHLQLRRSVRGLKAEVWQGALLYRHTGIGPGSWGRRIFIPGETVDDMVLRHELAHVRQWHTLDILLLRLVQVCLWPNFLYVFLLRELRMVHEFQADRHSAEDRQAYALELLNAVFGTRQFSFIHTFSQHPLNRRIMMLQKTKKLPVSRLLLLAASTCLMVGGLVFLNSTGKAIAAPAAYEAPASDTSIYNYADQMPEFDGDLNAYLAAHLQYPANAIKRKAEGRQVIRFVVGPDGQVSKPSVVRSTDPELAEAAIDLIKQMPRWKPGKQNGKNVAVYFVLPVQFKLQ